MEKLGPYDPDLQQFKETTKVNTDKLLFHRYLAQTGAHEHFPESRPCGDFALALMLRENSPVERVLAEALRVERLGDRLRTTRTIVQGD